MLTTSIALIAAMLAVVAMGTPLALMMATQHERRRPKSDPPSAWGDMNFRASAFAPLDLGPDLIKWPSELPWPNVNRYDVPWPSETWDDPQFGKGRAAAQAARQASADADATSVRARDARQIARNASDDAAQERAGALSAARDVVNDQAKVDTEARIAALRQQQAQAAAQRNAPNRPVKAQPAPAKQQAAPKTQPAQRSQPSGKVEFGQAEVEKLIETVGLAGTVQEIMRRTGADFRTAAQILAKARSGK